MSKTKRLAPISSLTTRKITEQYNLYIDILSEVLERNTPKTSTVADQLVLSEADLLKVALSYSRFILLLSNSPKRRKDKKGIIKDVVKYLNACRSAIFRIVPARAFSKLSKSQLEIHITCLKLIKKAITFTQQ